MRSLAPILAAVVLPALLLTANAQNWTPPPADAQPPATQSPQPDAPPGEPESGLDLIERGVGTFFENLMREVQPQMEDMARGLDQTFNRFAPVFDDLTALMDDIGNYQAPERLPNGDILIRRLPDAPPPPSGNALRDLTRPDPDVPAMPDPVPVLPGPSIDL